jgi:uncharacterized membrane protein HdeD (DUF308 family)
MFYQDLQDFGSELASSWWVFLCGGIAWLVIAAVVLRLNIASVATVGILLGAIFLLSAIEEFTIASFRDGWRFLRVILGILFLGGSIWSFVAPFAAFWALAAALGLLLIIKGAFDITYGAVAQSFNSLWWLSLVTGVLEIALGFWASQQYIPARAVLLLLWIGFYAIFRGIGDIVLAFEVRSVA